MALNRDQKIIVTSADGTKRRRLPALQVISAEARVERYGGYGQFTINTVIPYTTTALPAIIKGDRVELYYQNILRYRGYIEERTQSEDEPDKLALVGYGMSFLAGQQLCYGRYAYAGAGVDIASAFGEIVRDATSPRCLALLPAAGRQGLPLYGALQPLSTGTTTTFVDAYRKLLKDVLNDLVQNQAGNLATWGGDVDAFGQDRLYLRPVSPTTFPPQHTLTVPSRQVESAQSEDQAGDLRNRVLLTGAQPRFPQLVHNGGFDLPVVFQQGDSGLITDGDFENKSWSLSGGASYKDAGHQEGQPFSGNWMVEFDQAGKMADKSGTFATAPVVGDSYVFSVRAKKEVGLQVADGSGYLRILDVSSTLLLTIPLTVAPVSTSWDYFSQTFSMPVGAAKWAAHFQVDHVGSYNGDTGGLLIDAVSLEDTAVVYQDGYQTAVYGSAQFNAVNWVYKDTAYNGLYCVYVNVSASDMDGQDAHLEPLGRARFSFNFKQTIRGSVRFRSPVQRTAGLGIPKLQLHLDWYRSDGSYIGNSGSSVAAQAASSTWQYLEIVGSPPGDGVQCVLTVIFRSNGEVLIDAVSAQDTEALLAGNVPMDTTSGAGGTADGHPGYLPEGPLSTLLSASASTLGGAWAASESVYGSRVDVSGEGGVDTLVGLTQVATGRLRNTALPLTRPSLTRVSDPRVYLPGESISLQGKHGSALSGGQVLTIAAVALRFGDQFKVTLEIDKEAPAADLIVKRLILDQLTRNGPGASSGGGGGGGYSNPTSGGGGQGAAYRTTLQASSADATLHDAYVGVPHASAASQSGWTATSAEVVAGRTRTVKGVSGVSLEARLDLMEVDIAVGGGAKATAAVFGTVETDVTEAGGSIVYTKTTADSKFALASGLTAEATARTNADNAEAAARANGDALALQKSANLSDLANNGTARTNLGLGTAATKDVPASGNASAGQVVLGNDTRLGGSAGLAITESIGNGADLALSTAYQTIATISVSVAANAAADADALVEVVADVATGGDDLYVQLYDIIAGAAIQYSERHVSHIAAGKRGQVLLSKYVPGIAGGRTLVLQAKNATAARGTVNTNRSLLQVLGVSSGTSSGGGITSPTQVSGLTVWLNAGAITGTANGAALATWADTSGGSHNAAQATTALQPLYVTSGLNSKPVVRFNGTSQFLTLGDLSSFIPTGASLFIVATYNGSVQNQCLYSSSVFNSGTNVGDDFWYYSGNSGAYLSIFRAGRPAFSPAPSTGSNLFSIVSGASTWQMWINQVDKGAAASTYTPGTSHLLGHSNNAINNVYLNGDVSEVLIYNSALSATDRLNVEGYLKAKYGI